MVNPDPSFWRGRRVLVTGHTGFKGAWLSLWLESLGAEVSGLALAALPTEPSLFALACELGGRDRRADLREHADVRAVVEASRPEVVFHLGAQSLVRASYTDPVGTYATNVMGLVHLLDAVRHVSGVRVVVNVTSDKCYENREWLWAYREDEPMGGHDPYSSSKGCAELITTAWRRSYFAVEAVAMASARAGNVIGGGDWALDRIVPDCIRAFSAGRTVEVRNPRAVRPWQHVLEPLCGYLLLAERLWHDGAAVAEGWNFGPAEADALPVAEIVGTLAALWGEGAGLTVTSALQPHEAGSLKIDASKARARLGWQPRLKVATTLAWTAEWYRRQRDGTAARALCLEQIERYQTLETTR